MAQAPAVPPYGPPIHEAIARGDLQEMKALVREAERFLAQIGDLGAALEVLKAEVAKIEAKQQPPRGP